MRRAQDKCSKECRSDTSTPPRSVAGLHGDLPAADVVASQEDLQAVAADGAVGLVAVLVVPVQRLCEVILQGAAQKLTTSTHTAHCLVARAHPTTTPCSH